MIIGYLILELTGNTVDYFPNWDSPVTKCLNDPTALPGYIKGNHEYWLSKDLDDYCSKYYEWAFDKCITLSGGKVSAVAKNYWYVDWKMNRCVQSCLEQTGQVQHGTKGLNCGGIAEATAQLYLTPELCCEKQLAWTTL